MFRPVFYAFSGMLSLASITLFTGCSQSLESNPTFQEHVARVEKIEEALSDTKSNFSTLNREFQTVSKDVNSLVAAGPGGEATKALEARVGALENSIKGMHETLVSLNEKLNRGGSRRMVSASSADADADVAEANAPDAAGGGKQKGSRTVSGELTGRDQTAASAEAEAVADSVKPTGHYHLVRQGETIDKIAKRYRTTAGQILNANRIPAGRRLVPGQQIFVPNG